MLRFIAVLACAMSLICADASANGGSVQRVRVVNRPRISRFVAPRVQVQKFVAPVVVSPYVQRQVLVPTVQQLVVPQVQTYVAPQAIVVPQVQAYTVPQCSTSASFFLY